MEQPTLYVVARYATDRAYGGPEEGGWWYDVGELEKVVLATRDEDRAWDAVVRLNDARHRMRADRVGYTVVELPREELIPELRNQMCHGDVDDLWDESGHIKPEYRVTRWDIPTFYPEGRPHYC